FCPCQGTLGRAGAVGQADHGLPHGRVDIRSNAKSTLRSTAGLNSWVRPEKPDGGFERGWPFVETHWRFMNFSKPST
ncbi:MAG: hypothetical protein ACRD2B_14815, partial [Terriglobia bacterium]